MSHRPRGTCPSLKYSNKVNWTLDPATHPIVSPNLSPHTIVAVQCGQSMNAQYNNYSYNANHTNKMFQFVYGDGTLRQWVEPLYGGISPPLIGSWFGQFGDNLIDARPSIDVVQCMTGLGGTSSEQWGPRGEYHSVLTTAFIRLMEANLPPSLVYVGQGVTETFYNIPGAVWLDNWSAVVEIIRNIVGFRVPFFFEKQSYWCAPGYVGRVSDSVRDAQAIIINSANQVYAGADTDQFIAPGDRYDTQHWALSGGTKAAKGAADAVLAVI